MELIRMEKKVFVNGQRIVISEHARERFKERAPSLDTGKILQYAKLSLCIGKDITSFDDESIPKHIKKILKNTKEGYKVKLYKNLFFIFGVTKRERIILVTILFYFEQIEETIRYNEDRKAKLEKVIDKKQSLKQRQKIKKRLNDELEEDIDEELEEDIDEELEEDIDEELEEDIDEELEEDIDEELEEDIYEELE
jgi:signal recognition particle GTPase